MADRLLYMVSMDNMNATETLVGKLVTFTMPYAGKSGVMKAAGIVLAILADGRYDIRLQQGGYVQKHPSEITVRETPHMDNVVAAFDKHRLMSLYQLPDGRYVDVLADAAKGEPVIDFTLADGQIVKATLVLKGLIELGW